MTLLHPVPMLCPLRNTCLPATAGVALVQRALGGSRASPSTLSHPALVQPSHPRPGSLPTARPPRTPASTPLLLQGLPQRALAPRLQHQLWDPGSREPPRPLDGEMHTEMEACLPSRLKTDSHHIPFVFISLLSPFHTPPHSQPLTCVFAKHEHIFFSLSI